MGATLVVHSATKYLTGNGTVTGGIVVDSGKFNWSASDKFPSLSQPEPAYHGLVFHPTLGSMAFTFHSIAIGLRDLGMTMNPQGAHYTLMGIETLGLRMERHVKNAQKVAEWLEKDPRVEYVTYAGLKSSPYNKRAKKIVPKGAGALFTFALKSGYDGCVSLINKVKLFSHVANLGDTRSLIIHSASTTHRQLTEEQQIKAGAGRTWCGCRSGSRMSRTSSPISIRRWADAPLRAVRTAAARDTSPWAAGPASPGRHARWPGPAPPSPA
jgi:O-acetylhomoserine (thiol)-lyase